MQKLLNKRNQSPWHELSEILNLINEEVPCDNHVKKCRRHAGFKKKTPIDELYLQLEKCRLDRRASNLFWNFQNDSKTKLCHINLRMNHPVPARKKLLVNGKKKKKTILTARSLAAPWTMSKKSRFRSDITHLMRLVDALTLRHAEKNGLCLNNLLICVARKRQRRHKVLWCSEIVH